MSTAQKRVDLKDICEAIIAFVDEKTRKPCFGFFSILFGHQDSDENRTMDKLG